MQKENYKKRVLVLKMMGLTVYRHTHFSRVSLTRKSHLEQKVSLSLYIYICAHFIMGGYVSAIFVFYALTYSA